MSGAQGLSPFAQETAVVPDGRVPGRYRANPSKDWCAPEVPQGGLMTVVALRAMQAELGRPEQTLRTVTTMFAAPVRSGPVDVDVTVVRRGRSLSHLSATVRSVGDEAGHALMAVFGAPRDGFEFTDLVPPDVPPPEECPSFRDEAPGDFRPRTFSYWENVEGRPALGHAPWDDYEPITSERASWYRFDEPPRLADGRFDPLALVTLCDTMPGAVRERMGNDTPEWMPPSVDLTVHLFAAPRSEWVLGHNRARHAGEGYASLDMALWDPEVGLVAYGTQQMLFLFPDGPPPPEQRRAPASS
jgi:acyl-CoA thioesterase